MDYTTVYSKEHINKAIEKYRSSQKGPSASEASIINCGLKMDAIFKDPGHKKHKEHIQVVSVTPPVIWTTVDAMDDDKAPIAYHFDRGAAIIPILEDYAKLEQCFYENKIIGKVSIIKIFTKGKEPLEVTEYLLNNCYLSHLEALWDLRYCYLEFQVLGTMKCTLTKTDAAGKKQGKSAMTIEPLGKPTY